jgi:dipeptidyl aminopeptidase/acylaminoacyl peptidase
MSALLILASSAIIPLTLAPSPRADPCVRFDAEAPPASRPVEIRDLAQLADIGRSEPSPSPSPFGVSPDNRQIAFVVRRGNPDANGYCQRLLVMPLDASAPPVERDRGGEFIRDTFDLRNFSAMAAGWTKAVTPRWSRDGHTIAFLKRIDGSTQVWLADAAGTKARQATAMPDDIEDFAWSEDGTGLIVVTRPALRHELEAIAEEAKTGYLFDDRFGPHFANQPLPTAPHPAEYTYWSLGGNAPRPATAAEIERIVPSRPSGVPLSARLFAAGSGGQLAWTEPRDTRQLLSPSKLVIADEAGKRWTCADRRCEGVSGLWWSRDGRTLHFLQRPGWPYSQSGLYAWTLGSAEPRAVLVTDDALVGCARPAREVICAREASTRPRRLVAIDPQSGHEREIYDPNPGFARLRLGSVKRFHLRNAYGQDSHADLILPPGHRKGERHPLVVVQYVSDGFLRGGLADEVPIQALAARGFAVLSFSRPDFMPQTLAAPTELEMRRANRQDWADRRNVESSLEIAIQRAIATGAVDADRMGISGFSDGSSTVQWALINSKLFKAASLGGCCEDMLAYPLTGGPAFQRWGREMGYRFFEPDAAAFWKPMSLVLNADRVNTPILIQTGDTEYEAGLDVVAAWQMRGNPIELYVLDQEGHFKMQPAHRLAMYERTLEWFEFWLMGRMNCDPAEAARFARWRAMKNAPSAPTCAPPLATP